MRNLQQAPARLTAQQGAEGVLRVELAGDWLDRAHLPSVAEVERELAAGGVRAQFHAEAR